MLRPATGHHHKLFSAKSGGQKSPGGQTEKAYRWSPKKILLLEALSAAGIKHENIAKGLNIRFTEGVRANKNIVEARLQREVYKRRPELRRQDKCRWTPEKVGMLERLAGERITSKEIAERLNNAFPDGVPADECAVLNRLSRDVYKRRPELRDKYPWTPDKVKMLEELARDKISCKEMASRLNTAFPSGPRADAVIVMNKLHHDVHKKRPELRKWEKYVWSPEKVGMLERLAEEGVLHKDIAEKLNAAFPEGTRAHTKTVTSKLCGDIYKRRPELMRNP